MAPSREVLASRTLLPWDSLLILSVPCSPQAPLSPGPQAAYREGLSKLDLQYAKLLVRRALGEGCRGGPGRS